MNKILLSIIIVTYKNLEVIKDCLDSINKYNDIGNQLEIIVIDNSPDDTYVYNYVKENYKEIKIIKNENKGFGHGNNVGVKNSTGNYILFLNPDTILVEPIMKFAIKKFEEDSKLELFGVKLVDKNIKSNFSFYFDFNFKFIYLQLIKLLNKLNIFIEKKMFIAGADIFVRRSTFINVGMFDENIFMYGEEGDLIRRIKLNDENSKIKFFKEKKIIHLEGRSSEIKEKATEERLKSSIYYGKKYNLNINNRLSDELNYLKLKAGIYRIINKKKYSEIVKLINIMIKYKKLVE